MQILKLFFLIMILTVGFYGNGCSGDSGDDLTAYSLSLREEFPGVAVISTSELGARQVAPVLLDARSEEEFAVSHIPGAIRAGDQIEGQLHQMKIPEDDEIVVYCSVGYRSAKLAKKLSAAGYVRVKNLEGSIFAWANEGRPMVNQNGPTTGVHPFNSKWGRFLEKSHWRWKLEEG